METWMVVPLAILVIGVAVVLYGAVRDRTKRRRAEAILSGPPERTIPGFHPTAHPTYLLATEAHRRITPLPSLDSAPVARSDGQRIPYGFASPEFATHAGDLALLDSPRVLVCAEPMNSFGELVPLLVPPGGSNRALVLVAPGFADEVSTTLGVNVVRRGLPVLAIAVPDAEARADLAARSGATPIDGFDLTAGYVPDGHLGTASQWLSDSGQSWVLWATPAHDADTHR